MIHTFKQSAESSFFGISTDYIKEKDHFESSENLISIHWNKSDQPIELRIDGVLVILKPDQLTTTTYFQQVRFPNAEGELITFSFNREFYCINDHDHEVSCNGVIFFGTQAQPIVTLEEEEKRKFELLLEVLLDEYQTRDRVQGEMLRILLKRLIIKVTRLAQDQLVPKEVADSQIDTIRKFNVMVDMHFRDKRHVADYADMLFKSPKTLANLFAKYNDKTPLQTIHERIVLEAKRLLIYTDKSAKEIAQELGYNDSGAFHKLFRKSTGTTPQLFKESQKVVDLS